MQIDCIFCGERNIEVMVHTCTQDWFSYYEDQAAWDQYEAAHKEWMFLSIQEEEEKLEEKANMEMKRRSPDRIMIGQIKEKGSNKNTSGWGSRRWLKQKSNRAFRRLAKQDPEFAPTKMQFAGWES